MRDWLEPEEMNLKLKSEEGCKKNIKLPANQAYNLVHLDSMTHQPFLGLEAPRRNFMPCCSCFYVTYDEFEHFWFEVRKNRIGSHN